MAIITLDGESSIKKDLETIQSFTDEQINFYRYNEANYYHDILKIINYIKELRSKTLYLEFMGNEKIIKDFKELFELFIDDKEYNSSSTAKQNFHATIKNLIEIINSYNKRQKKEFTNVERALQIYEEKFNTMEKSLKNYQDTSNILHKDFKDKNNKIDTIAKKAQNIETAFSEHHKIFETKKYWQEKSSKHFWTSFISFSLFLALICMIIYFVNGKIDASKLVDIENNPSHVTIVSLLTENNISKIEKSPQLIEYKKTLEKHMIIRSLQYLFLLSLVLWLARILLKITFSHLHLKEEAHEKETMIMTYLALINDGGALKDNDRQLILEAIFRPSTNGLIKDETNVTLLDIVKGLKK